MIAARRKSGGTLPRQMVFHHQLAGERQDEGDDRNRNRAAHPIRRDAKGDVALRAGRHINRVVTHAKARHDAEPAVLRNALRSEAMD